MTRSRRTELRRCASNLLALLELLAGLALPILLCAGCAHEPPPAWRAETRALLEDELPFFTLSNAVGILYPMTRLTPNEIAADAEIPWKPDRGALPQHARALLQLPPEEFGEAVRELTDADTVEARIAGLVLNQMYGGVLAEDELLRVIEDEDSYEVMTIAGFAVDADMFQNEFKRL